MLQGYRRQNIILGRGKQRQLNFKTLQYEQAYFDIAWATEPRVVAPFQLMAVIDAAHPALVNPVAAERTTDDCSCCGGGGPITAKVSLEKNGFLTSECIKGKVSIKNDSAATIKILSCRLIQSAIHKTDNR